MNFTANHLINCLVHAQDGDVGRVEQLYFDDLTWGIRYLTLRTKGGLPGHNVLIPVSALSKPDWKNKVIPITLTMTQVFSSPSTEIDEPVSRQHEIELHRYYAWPGYWDGSFYIPLGYRDQPKNPMPVLRKANPNLRSMRELENSKIHGPEGVIGTIEDVLVDDQTWRVQYLIVNPHKLRPHSRILIAPNWIEKVDWLENRIHVNLDQAAVSNCPKYDPAQPLTSDFEQELRVHLRKPENKEWVQFNYHAPPRTKVYLAGTFNRWDPASIKLGYHGNRTYSTMLLLPVGYYEYKYVVDGVWRNSPDCKDLVSNAFGSQNSKLIVKHMTDHKVHLHTFPRLANVESTRLWSAPAGG